MVQPQIILAGCFSNRSSGKILIPYESIYDLSQLNFDGEGDTLITDHASIFLKLCEHYEINSRYVTCVIFSLTVEF